MKEKSQNLSRIDKFFADRDSVPIKDSYLNRQKYKVTLAIGEDVAGSYILQLSVLTAAILAKRCFTSVHILLPEQVDKTPSLVLPGLRKKKSTFGSLLRQIVGNSIIVTELSELSGSKFLLFGDVPEIANALRVTFDGWIAKTGPVSQVDRMKERSHCSLAGILAAAMGVSELFMSFANIVPEAANRTIALSLWRPDLEYNHPSAIGPVVEWLPSEVWVLGLGHLGNAYLWALGTLPYEQTNEVKFLLNDFDTVEFENIETSLLFRKDNLNQTKARTCSSWLERHGFRTRLVERYFDKHFRCRKDEPRLALSGFDSYPPRRDLDMGEFAQVIDCGLGGTQNNFDTLNLHVLPNPRKVNKLWPDLVEEEKLKLKIQRERLANKNQAYAHTELDECGRLEFAGKSIAVPFVGAVAGCFVVAETLRLFQEEGPAYTDIKLRLDASRQPTCIFREPCVYGVDDIRHHKSTRAVEI